MSDQQSAAPPPAYASREALAAHSSAIIPRKVHRVGDRQKKTRRTVGIRIPRDPAERASSPQASRAPPEYPIPSKTVMPQAEMISRFPRDSRIDPSGAKAACQRRLRRANFMVKLLTRSTPC